MPEPRVLLEPDKYFHIYNHSVGRENLFNNEKDYHYFLKTLKEYVIPISDILSYCMLPNHFHLVVRIKNESMLKEFLKGKENPEAFERKLLANALYLNERLSKTYSNFFNTYAKHYNFTKGRTGSLFKRAFHRKPIEDIGYLKRLICYIHRNPIEAGFTDKPESWRYSSYNAILTNGLTLIPRKEVIELFGDLDNFRYCHAQANDIVVGF